MPHPLDPLGADEIRDAVALLRADARVPDDPRFADVHLDEPHKDVVAAFDDGGRDAVDRRVRFRLVAGPELAALEALVSLTTRQVVSVQKVEGVCPTILLEESWLAVFNLSGAHPAASGGAVAAADARRWAS